MKVGIIGNGFVGRAVYQIHHLKHEVLIYDIDPARSVNTIAEIRGCEIIFICVPTPWNGEKIDISSIESSLTELLGCDADIIIKSTVPVGTTTTMRLKYGLNVFFSPEFLTERRHLYDAATLDHIINGGGSERLERLYHETFGAYFNVVNTKRYTAELVKYMRNSYFALKVTFMNEIYEICDKIGIDYDDAKDLFALSPFVEFAHLDVPGHDGKYGYGGKCFPKDVSQMIEMSDSELFKIIEKLNLKHREK